MLATPMPLPPAVPERRGNPVHTAATASSSHSLNNTTNSSRGIGGGGSSPRNGLKDTVTSLPRINSTVSTHNRTVGSEAGSLTGALRLIDQDLSPNPKKAGAGAGAGGATGGHAQPQLRISKLESEVKRLETKGAALLKKDGSELEGVDLLEKALSARARFPTLQKEPWTYGEHFVVICNQLAVRELQRLGDQHVDRAKSLLLTAERVLSPNQANDPFAGFHPLRQLLLSATVSNFAYLQRMMSDPIESVVATMEKALAIEGSRPTTLTLFNLAAAYAQSNQFDEAADHVTKCLALCTHLLSLPLTLNHPRDAYNCKVFEAETAHHAILAHHLIATLALWSGSITIARHHSRLALQCSEKYLGEEHALTTRCMERMLAMESDDWRSIMDPEDDNCPEIPLEMATFTSGVPPSVTIPFFLVSPPPISVRGDDTKGDGKGGDKNALQSQLLSKLRGKQSKKRANSMKPPGWPMNLMSPGKANKRQQQSELLDLAPIASALGLPAGASLLVPGATTASTGAMIPFIPPVPRLPLSDRPATTQAGARPGRTLTSGLPGTPQTGQRSSARPGDFASESAEKPKKGVSAVPRPPLKPKPLLSDQGAGSSNDPDIEESGANQAVRSSGGLQSLSQSDPTQQQRFVPSAPTKPGTPATVRPGSGRAHVATPPPIQTTIIPKSDYEQYMALQAEVERVVALGSLHPSTKAVQTASMGTLAAVPVAPLSQTVGVMSHAGAGPAVWRRGWDETPPIPQVLHRDDAPAEFEDLTAILRRGDAQLKKISRIVPDHTDEEEALWQASARKIQRQWRITKARLEVRRRQRAVRVELERQQSHLVITDFLLRGIHLGRARKIAAQKKHELQMNAFAKVIQRFARMWLSVEATGRTYLAYLQAQKTAWESWKKRECAATVIEAVWRSHRCRIRLLRQQKAVGTLQRTWRLFKLYNLVRIVVFARRQRRRERALYLHSMAARLQRWAHLCVLRHRAKAILLQKKHALQQALQEMHAGETRYWDQLKLVDESACVRVIQRMCRRYETFNQMRIWFAEERLRIMATKSIQRWYRFMTAKQVMERWRKRRQQRLLLQKRRQEVKEACVDIQRVVRGFLARRRVKKIRAAIQRQHDAAGTIQRFSRRCARRRAYRQLQQQRSRDQNRYLVAQLRQWSATKIQAVWRSHRDRVFTRQYRVFMTRTRHVVAKKIQRLARRFLARLRRLELAKQFALQTEGDRIEQLRNSAAIRIQKTWRMHHEKSSKYDVLFAPTEARRRAAQMFQRLWRFYSAKVRVQRLLMARIAEQQELISKENRIMYAIVLQRFVRKYILAQRRLRWRQSQVESDAARQIQKIVRGRQARRNVEELKHKQFIRADEKFQEEDVMFSATRIQKMYRGHSQRTVYKTVRRSAKIIFYALRRNVAIRRVQRLRQSRLDAQAATLTKERHHAATTIQSAFRYRKWKRSLLEKDKSQRGER